MVPNLPIDGPRVFRRGAVDGIVSFLFDIFHDVEFSIFFEAEYYVVLIFICKMWQLSAAWLFITTLISNWPGSTTPTSSCSSSSGLLNLFGIMTWSSSSWLVPFSVAWGRHILVPTNLIASRIAVIVYIESHVSYWQLRRCCSATSMVISWFIIWKINFSCVLYIKLKTKELITIVSERPISYLEETCKPRSMKHSPSSLALLSSMVCTFLSKVNRVREREREGEVLIIGGKQEAKWAFWIWKRKPRSYSAVKSVMCIINLSLCFFFVIKSHLCFWKEEDKS